MKKHSITNRLDFETSGTKIFLATNFSDNEIFFGTDQDDFMLGSGDDVIESGAGSDHLDGVMVRYSDIFEISI